MTAALAAATLSACSTADKDIALTSFFSEAGSQLDTGNFGEATMNNRLVQTGAQDYTIGILYDV